MSSSASSTKISGMGRMSERGKESGSWNSTPAIGKSPGTSCAGVESGSGGGHEEDAVKL